MKPHDEPLFVLRYRWSMRAGLISIYALIIWFAWFVILADPAKTYVDQLLFRPLLVFASLISLCQLMDLLLFREIRLYRDRIVKVRKFIGSREMKLENARLEAVGLRNDGSVKSFFGHNPSPCRRLLHALYPIGAIRYFERLATPQDVEELTRHLAHVSGRNVDEFRGPHIEMSKLIKGAPARKTQELEGDLDKLIKECTRQRIVSKGSLDEVVVFHDDPIQKAYDRTENRVLFIAMVALLMPSIVLLVFVIWFELR
jgi:hypothetical protein